MIGGAYARIRKAPKPMGIGAEYALLVRIGVGIGIGAIGDLGRMAARHVPNCPRRQANGIVARTVSRAPRFHCFPDLKLK